jgi:hypothetical protein
MGPGKILSGIKDVTEKVLVISSQFVVDGPVDIRWYGRKIFHMLMAHSDFDKLLVKYLNENVRKNIKEILDSIKVKGPGDVPTESARNSRKTLRNNDSLSKSAGTNNGSNSNLNIRVVNNLNSVTDREGNLKNINLHDIQAKTLSNVGLTSLRYDPHYQDFVKNLCLQMRNPDFRERIEAIEKFQVICETQTDVVITNIIQVKL